ILAGDAEQVALDEDGVAAAQRLGDVADAARRQGHHVALGNQDGGAIAFEADGFAAAGIHGVRGLGMVHVRRVASARRRYRPEMVAARRHARTPLYRRADGILSGFRPHGRPMPALPQQRMPLLALFLLLVGSAGIAATWVLATRFGGGQ